MPNWCHNKLEIRGQKNDLLHFFARAKNGTEPLSFASIVPEPGCAEEDADYDWWTWRLKNWGCKWDVGGADFDFTEERIPRLLYSFHTPWSPPMEWTLQASSLFPELDFVLRYGEPGNYFAGELCTRRGEVVRNLDLEVEEVLSPSELWY